MTMMSQNKPLVTSNNVATTIVKRLRDCELQKYSVDTGIRTIEVPLLLLAVVVGGAVEGVAVGRAAVVVVLTSSLLLLVLLLLA